MSSSRLLAAQRLEEETGVMENGKSYDVIVLGAGIVGTCVALHLAKRGLSVALVDRRGPGEETSYGNAGLIEGATVYPQSFPRGLSRLVRIALHRAPGTNYHLAFLPRVTPWLFSFRSWSTPALLEATAYIMRPLFARAVAEHEELLRESDALQYLRRTGWLKVYRTESVFAATLNERELASEFMIPHRVLDVDEAQALEPSLGAVFSRAVLWESVASISNPLAETRALAARFSALGGAVIRLSATGLRRTKDRWNVETSTQAISSPEVVVCLGPWTPDMIRPLGVKLPLAVKRGYHLHFHSTGNAGLGRPVVDIENGYCLAPMEQGIRVTTGAEFAHRDAPATPVQFNRVLPAAKQLFPLGAPAESVPWMGSRPCFADSRPVIGRCPGHPGLWLAFGHGHWGLTLGPVTGRLIAELISGATPFCDPTPYGAERFG
jgi:D-amino-acid dehydrogenase